MSISECFQLAMAVGTWGIVIATWKLVIATSKIVATHNETTRASLCVSNQLHFEKIFDDKRMLSERSKLAKQLINQARHEEIQDTVMNFFETVGILQRRGYFDMELAWSGFCYYATYWWISCREYIIQERMLKEDETIFEEFQQFVERLNKFDFEKRKLPAILLQPSINMIREFLDEEINASLSSHDE